MGRELAEPYYLYGKALLDLSRCVCVCKCVCSVTVDCVCVCVCVCVHVIFCMYDVMFCECSVHGCFNACVCLCE